MSTNASPASTDRLVAANEDAATFYRRQLMSPENVGPRAYLSQRGFGQLLEDNHWTVGFAPDGWTSLRDHLSALGYTNETLLSAGLLAESRRGPYDRFRGRITFGIRNDAGELVGFTARSAPYADARVPKYLNTPATRLFHKSAELFGLGEQVIHGAESTLVAIVEGPLDAIAIDIAGRESPDHISALALCGTVLSATHVGHVQSLSPRAVIVVLDEDAAGRSGRERAYLQLRDRIEHLLCPTFPLDHDPADIFRASGGITLREHLASTRPLADQLVDDRLASWPNLDDNAEARVACLRETAALVACMGPADLTREAGRLPAALNLSQQTVTRELAERVAAPTTRLHRARLST
ncbi:toprim domain-containing protein [Marmoricola sp. URHB0036]|uniref:toprim domain-containing protein n=1 Tax=Marmoricola sp. URHB0036 TaxID=1298863 RepID=UPI0004098EF1|nr:toprim domain-containing protein [Marmoricola sp. URHB0036]